MTRVLGKFSRRREAAAFAKWRDESREARAERLKKQRRKAQSAEEAEKTERLLKRAAARIFGKTLQNAFERWRSLSRETREVTRAFAKAARKITTLRERATFNAWMAFCLAETRRREATSDLLERAARAYARRMLVRWADTTRGRNEMRRRMRRVIVRVKASKKRLCFHVWLDAIEKASRLHRVEKKVANKKIAKQTARAFTSWTARLRDKNADAFWSKTPPGVVFGTRLRLCFRIGTRIKHTGKKHWSRRVGSWRDARDRL